MWFLTEAEPGQELCITIPPYRDLRDPKDADEYEARLKVAQEYARAVEARQKERTKAEPLPAVLRLQAGTKR